jgi:hypothetical protein
MPPTIDIKRGDHGPAAKNFQTEIDRELKQQGFPWRKIVIDGQAGENTFDAANMLAWLKGFSSNELHAIGKQQKISHRDVLILTGHAGRSKEMKHRAEARHPEALKLIEKHKHPGPTPIPGAPDRCWLDGHEVPIWIATILIEARNAGVWHGVVISGYRSPAYSEELCLNMCGAPSCPGRCAGRSTNHACPPDGTGAYPEGAVDVTDYVGLRTYCEAHAPTLRGGGVVLPADLPHFSHNGN